jgi:hypothetical protein
MDGKRGYEVPSLANTDVVGIVDSDYGHALDAVVGPAYSSPTLTDPNSYHRFFFVIRNPMYVLVADELESGHSTVFNCYTESGLTKSVAGDYFTSSRARYELLYPPSPGFDSSSASSHPITFTTSSPQLLVLVHPNSSAVSFSKTFPSSNLVAAVIGTDTIVYNPSGGSYSQSGISGNAKLFAQRTGGAIIFKATTAAGSQYGISCDVPVNISVKDRNASIYVYGTGSHTVNVTSPFGSVSWVIVAGQTVGKSL